MKKRKGIVYQITALFGKGVIRLLEIPVALSVPRNAVFDSNQFTWVERLEKQWPDIQREYLALAETPQILPDIRDISEEQQHVISPNLWTFYPFILYGIPLQGQLESCPKTAQAIAEIPNCTTAFFSVLKPGAEIAPHRGAYKGYLRLHLGVVVPSPEQACGLRMENKTYHWKEGKSLLFDDTFVHDAFNNAASERVVLYIDFIRPMSKIWMRMSQGLTWLISKSVYVQGSIRNLSLHKSN